MVSDQVTRRVRRIADEMRYHADPFAYGLKTKRSFTIGVLIPDLCNPVFPPVIRAVERTLGEAGYIAILAESDNHPEQARVVLEKMKARRVDGLILATALRADHLIAECVEEGLPVVLVNRTVDGDGVVCVNCDEFEGMRLTVGHVAELGHRTVAHIAGPQFLSTGHDRYRGFLRAMHERELAADSSLIRFCDAFSEEAGRAALEALLDASARFTAVVAANDLLAVGCYDALERRGLACPRDLSVTGFNDMPFVNRFEPPLTTVHFGLDEMGSHAARALLDLLDGNAPNAESIRLAPRLIVRESTAPPPSGGSPG